MTANTDFDCKLKCGLIDDVLTIVNLEGLITGDEMTVGAFDLISNKGVYVNKSPFSYTQTNLGWKCDR
jgi:tubulin polyglutamylase TTLL9